MDCAPQAAPTTGNAVLLERLVHNLVENGIRHNLPDGGWVRVTSGTRHDGTVAVTVSNTGPGRAARTRSRRLFEPFRRLGARPASAAARRRAGAVDRAGRRPRPRRAGARPNPATAAAWSSR